VGPVPALVLVELRNIDFDHIKGRDNERRYRLTVTTCVAHHKPCCDHTLPAS
jgi:hypothetical protein